MNTGFIKLHRKISEWQWADNPNTLSLFIHLLLSVNWEDKKWKGKIIKRGSIATSIDSLVQKTGIKRMTVRRSLDRLVETGEVSKQKNNQGILITIVNYEKYQGFEVINEEDRATKGANERANGRANGRATTKEVKKRRKKEVESTGVLSESPDDDSVAKKTRRENIFWKRIVTRYPSNRIGNRQHAIKKWMELSDEEMIQADQNMEKYLSACEGYVKTLQNYITEKCFTEKWIQAEIETNKKTNTTKEKLLTDPKNYKEKQIWDKYTK